MAITNGTLYVIQSQTGSGSPAAWVILGCLTSNGWSGTTEAIDGNSKCNPDYAESIPGRISMEMSGELNLAESEVDKNVIRNLWKNKSIVPFRTANTENEDDIVQFSGYISSYEETFDDNAAATASITITGVGEPVFA